MDTIRQFEGAMADGGPGAVARALVEACVNEVMSARADAMCEETGTSRNGFRERGLETQVGAITLRIVFANIVFDTSLSRFSTLRSRPR